MKNCLLATLIVLVAAIGTTNAQQLTPSTTGSEPSSLGTATATILCPIGDYVFIWTDSDGNVINSNCQGDNCTISNLLPGEYCVEVLSLDASCDQDEPSRAYQCVNVEGVSCQNSLEFFWDISDPLCGSFSNDGFLAINFSTSNDPCWRNNSGLLDLEWSNGVEGLGRIVDLQVGTYCVTIKADAGGSCPDCYAHLCNTIEGADDDIDLNGYSGDRCFTTVTKGDPPLQYYYLVFQPGFIILNPTGGSGDLTITWLDGYEGPSDIRPIGAEGTYCVQVQDECENSKIECFEIGTYTGEFYCLSPAFEDQGQGPFLLPDGGLDASLNAIYESNNTLTSEYISEILLVQQSSTEESGYWNLTSVSYPHYPVEIALLSDEGENDGDSNALLRAGIVTQKEYKVESTDKFKVFYNGSTISVIPGHSLEVEQIAITMFNASGQVVHNFHEIPSGESITIQTDEYPAGMYFLTAKNHETAKLVIFK